MKTRILITIGDINGIGPEIILKTLKNPAVIRKYDLTVVSPFSVLSYYSKKLNIRLNADKFGIFPIGNQNPEITPGRIDAESGFISGLAIKTAIELCISGEYDAIVTAPISKKALNLGGFRFTGHTEMLSSFSGAKDPCMLMLSDKLNIGFATTHPPLSKVPAMITGELLRSKLSVGYNSLVNDLRIKNPAIAVLGLNPHAGDGGLIGEEEALVIAPVIKKMNTKYRKKVLSGPHSPDAFFAAGEYRKFDMTFAMYHDQGFIPFKMLAGHKGTNYTAGLPIVRTSPDHGTAFDIAGKNRASEVSLIEGIKWADRIFRNRSRKSN